MIPAWIKVGHYEGNVFACPLYLADDETIMVPGNATYHFIGRVNMTSWEQPSDRSGAVLHVRGWEWSTTGARGRALTKASAVAALVTHLGYRQVSKDAANPGLFE